MVYKLLHCGCAAPVPCPPQALVVEESDPENCTFSWDSVTHVDYYQGFIKRNDGVEKDCNTTGNSCQFHCPCGFTYRTSVFAHNLAGVSAPGPVLNYTTSMSLCQTMLFLFHFSMH